MNKEKKITIQNLLTVKSLVTLILTAVFAYLSIDGTISGEQFLTIFSVVVAFYLAHSTRKDNRMKKKRWKINDDTLTSIVIYSLLFCVLVVAAGFTFAWFGRDVSAIVSSALAVFGTELGICGLMKIYDKWSNWQDKKEEERRERRKRNG